MIGKLNHVAIAVKNISSAAKTYKKIFGAQVSEPLDQPIHGVTVVFVTLPVHPSLSSTDLYHKT